MAANNAASATTASVDAAAAADPTCPSDAEKMRLEAQREAERDAEIHETAAATTAALEAGETRLKAEREADEKKKQHRILTQNPVFNAALSDCDDNLC